MPQATLIHGMKGLGDNIFQRAFVKPFAAKQRHVYIETPWPELYADLPVGVVKVATSLRTQAKNQSVSAASWVKAPVRPNVIRVGYGHYNLSSSSIVKIMEGIFGVSPEFSLPPLPACPVVTDKPIAVVRPVTVRTEWRNEARNPRPEYICQAADELRERGFHVVSIADLAPGLEWLVGDAPSADTAFHAGELRVMELLALIANASICVGGVGWLLPACAAAGVPMVVVAGGQGGHNGPARVTDERMQPGLIRWVMPDNYCECGQMLHRCDKTIKQFRSKFCEAIQ
jgi:hypothetical protein